MVYLMHICAAQVTAAGTPGSESAELRAMATLIRDVELVSLGGDTRALANPDVRPVLERLATYRGERGVAAHASIDRALEAVERNAGVKVVADWIALQL